MAKRNRRCKTFRMKAATLGLATLIAFIVAPWIVYSLLLMHGDQVGSQIRLLEREKRALIAASEGRRQEQINIATGEREAFIARSEGEKQAAINKAQGDAAAITTVAEATAQALERVAAAIRQPGGEQAVQLKVAESAVEAYSKVAQDANTTLIVPSNISEVSGLIASAMRVVQQGKNGQ